MRRCERCREPLADSTRSHARFCGDACRSAAWRAKRLDREAALLAEARKRDEHLAYARSWLRRQTSAIVAGDLAALDTLTAEADAFFASLGDAA